MFYNLGLRVARRARLVLALALVAVAAFSLGLEAQRRDGGLSGAVVGTSAAVGELLVLLIATLAG